MNELFRTNALSLAVSVALLGGVGIGGLGSAQAAVNVQCPEDDDHDGIPPADIYGNVLDTDDTDQEHIKCMHLTSGDGFSEMSDGHPAYIFGFADHTGTAPADVIADGILDAHWPGSKIVLEEGDQFYLSLTNVGTVMRPDLFDPHTVHYHGFPNAATVFDGVPEVSIAINMGSTLTYYYNVVEPGTYLYHCHVEATEHMEMGMLANLYVHPAQDVTGCPSGACPVAQRKGGPSGAPMGYVYNDNDGTTGYEVEAPIQVSGFDSHFHDAHIQVQPLPFASLRTNYPQINGRGYPDTVLDKVDRDPQTEPVAMGPPMNGDGSPWLDTGVVLNNGDVSQNMGSRIEASAGDRILLRLTNVSIDRFFTMTAPGLKMRIVGTGARQMRGVDGKNLYVETTSVNFGGGESHDVIIDTEGVAPGTYFLTAAELYQMSNGTQLDGGLITEIVLN